MIGRVGSFGKALAIALLGVLVGGCVPLPGAVQYMRVDADLTANGRPYALRQFFRCYQQADFSEADAQFHRRVHAEGVGTIAVDVGDNLVVLLRTSVGGCDSDSPASRPEVSMLVNPGDPQRIYPVAGSIAAPDVKVHTLTVTKVASAERPIGPTAEQAALKELIRNRQHGFQRVSVRIIPPRLWATSENVRAYFRRYHAIAVAQVGEELPTSGLPNLVVRFRYAKDRAYQRDENGAVGELADSELIYGDDAFEMPSKLSGTPVVWYATHETRDNHPNPNNAPAYALVRIKGMLVRIQGLQEVFDPDTQNILQFQTRYLAYPWGGPDDVDVKRALAPSR